MAEPLGCSRALGDAPADAVMTWLPSELSPKPGTRSARPLEAPLPDHEHACAVHGRRDRRMRWRWQTNLHEEHAGGKRGDGLKEDADVVLFTHSHKRSLLGDGARN